jgi:hypothetical protein
VTADRLCDSLSLFDSLPIDDALEAIVGETPEYWLDLDQALDRLATLAASSAWLLDALTVPVLHSSELHGDVEPGEPRVQDRQRLPGQATPAFVRVW